ncbi:hypothetical protein KUCAC02_002483 [Chaenocephalus aceratus]|uniref:Uncharacterized protein n=1 Tax=Chaenocephalus aceratus TaxID=36190 RepID=A0ACB9XUW8_CHAAC|nr:hypothetical protein KUCAC02_002483 [Chaenocephalus aceratus]
MGNSYAGQLRTTRFEEVLHNSIEASLRSNTVVARPVFSQLYLETEQPLTHNGRTENDDDDDEDGSESNSPPLPYQMKTPPEGCCTTDGFCQAGRDLRLSSLASDPLDVSAGFMLVGVKSPSLPETLLTRGHNALLGFLGNCMGCGEKGFRYFTEFSNHINLKLNTQPKKQKHLKHHLYRNNQGVLVKGAPICWRGHDGRMRQTVSILPEGHVASDEPPPNTAPTLPLHTPGGYTAGSNSDPVNLPQVADAPHPLTNGIHVAPSVAQPSLNPSGPGRPSATGSHANAGPPKKRHKGWSPESSANSVTESAVKTPPSSSASAASSMSSLLTNGARSETAAPLSSSQASLTSLSPPGLAVTIPDQLLHTCRLQPVIFKELTHKSVKVINDQLVFGDHLTTSSKYWTFSSRAWLFPQLTGNISEVLLSSLLQSCYLSSQTLPRVYQHYGPSPIQPLSTEMQILLTVYYLVQLGPDQVPLIEDLEQIFMRSWRESHLSEIRQYQQPQTPASQGRHYGIETSSILPGLPQHLSLLPQSQQPLTPSLQQTVSRLMEGRLENTNYVAIIVTVPGQETQSCVVVTGKHQCRALAESMYSPNEGLKEINHQLSLGAAQELIHYCNSLGQDGDLDSLLDSATLDSNEPSPLSSYLDSAEEKSLKTTHSPKDTPSPKNSKDSPSPKGRASKYSVKWREVRPIQLAVARKLLSHVCAIADSSTQNLDLGSFDRVSFLILVPPSEVTFQQTVFHLWSSGVLQELGGLDQECVSQREAERMCNSDSGLGLVDQLLNSRQTQFTRISPYNEIHWPSAFSNDVDLYHEKTRYFGVSELLESTRSGSSLPLMRYDSSFESMASALEERFPKLHSSVIRTTVLIQHYCVALMAASGKIGSSHNLHKHTSVETLEIVQSLLTAAQQCPTHHGHMVLLRIPSQSLAAWAHRRLSRVRRQLGLEDTFEIILGNPNQALSIGQSFTDQIKTWLKIQDADWVPQTYLELEALPCILILSGAEPQGESMPRSLKYCDLRVISCSYLQRTTLEQELGLAAYLVRAESRPPHNPGPGSDLLESDAAKLSSTDNEEEEGQENRDSPLSSSQQLQSCPEVTSPTLQIHLLWLLVSASLLSSPELLLGARCESPALCAPPSGPLRFITASDSSGLPRCTSFLPHMSVAWASSFRPLLSKMMTCTEQSLYYRQWTVPRSYHMDSSNRTEGRSDNFHPRRLLLSGPPQVGKTGAYLHFLGILSRMLIRLMEVDIYDEEDINYSCQAEGVLYHPSNVSWPNPDIVKTMPFDYTIHDPKYEEISSVYCPGYKSSADVNPVRQEDVYLRRRTSRIKLSKYAAYNTYHHCEQCHQYLGINPRYQMYESTLHAFTFTHLLLGEEIQLYFIIPKSKEHYFSFSQSGGQLESMRLPLISDWSPDCIKSPIFTPTTGRHEHGLFNLYHAMDGASHLHILVVKEYEMAVYKKYWPNHIMLVLPTVFNGAGIGAAHFLIKELSYHNLELERSRRLEGGGPAGDVWPFIILTDDSCVMWNAVDLDARNGAVEHAVSLKHILQHMEACPDLAHYGLCGVRKWSSRGLTENKLREPFSRGHLHDFLLLNVDRSQNVQYDQNRFTCHDVDFTLRLHSAGLLVCRFNAFSVMKKQIAIGGYRTFIIKTKTTDVPTSVGPSQYICAPDSKHLFLATPAQLLLEKYLQHTSQKLFPHSTKNYTHPVLSVDCYLNLGPEVTVCFVSSRPHSVNISSTGLLFSGLLLCFADSFVTAGFLKKFSFLKGATLCVISADRSSLRQTVGRLELEEEWRFRLSDEFQTANAKEDRPLFFLTGKHI